MTEDLLANANIIDYDNADLSEDQEEHDENDALD